MAQQVGCKRQTLRSKFPDLCNEITTKYLAGLKKQHEERVAALCRTVRQTVFTLHQQGRYPSSVEVLKVLGNQHMMRMKEAQIAWQGALEELGYRAKNRDQK